MPAAETRKTRLTDRKRSDILQAAAAEFRANGFDNTSMDRIAESAAVSKRTVYNHFPSKEDLFAAILHQLLSRLDRLADHPYDPEQSLETQLTAFGQSMVQLAGSEDFQSLARVVMSRFLQTPELTREALGDFKFEEGLARWMRAARKDGRLAASHPEQAAKQFMGLIKSLAFWPQIFGDEPPLTKRQQTAVIRSAVAMFLDHYAN